MKKLFTLTFLACTFSAHSIGFLADSAGKPVRDHTNACVTSWDTPSKATIRGCNDSAPIAQTVQVETRQIREVPKVSEENIATAKVTLAGPTFDVNKTQIKKSGQAKLDQLAKDLKSTLGNGTINIRGYADPTGPEAHNRALSQERAVAARDYLVKKGIPARNIRAEGAGETNEAVCDFKDKSRMVQCFEKDRKVEIEVPNRKL